MTIIRSKFKIDPKYVKDIEYLLDTNGSINTSNNEDIRLYSGYENSEINIFKNRIRTPYINRVYDEQWWVNTPNYISYNSKTNEIFFIISVDSSISEIQKLFTVLTIISTEVSLFERKKPNNQRSIVMYSEILEYDKIGISYDNINDDCYKNINDLKGEII